MYAFVHGFICLFGCMQFYGIDDFTFHFPSPRSCAHIAIFIHYLCICIERAITVEEKESISQLHASSTFSFVSILMWLLLEYFFLFLVCWITYLICKWFDTYIYISFVCVDLISFLTVFLPFSLHCSMLPIQLFIDKTIVYHHHNK